MTDEEKLYIAKKLLSGNVFKSVCSKCGKIEHGINTYLHYHDICEECYKKQ